MKKIVFVTGAGGLIGSEACRFYHSKGYDVIGIDNENTRKIYKESQNKEKFIPIAVEKNQYKFKTKLIGKHNLENILASFEVAKFFDLNEGEIVEKIADFEPLPHRFEKIAEYKAFMRSGKNEKLNMEEKYEKCDKLKVRLNIN